MGNTDDSTKIQFLEKQVQELKIENARLREENELLKIGWIPSSIQTTPWASSTTIIDNWFLPEWTTFEEGNGVECMQKAYSEYIAAWTKKCKSLWYTDAQIQKDECQLDNAFIQSIQKQKTNVEATCGPR